MTALGAEAFAKINRELRVGSRRPDGFHEILSRFSSIDLSDRIHVEQADALELVPEGLEVPSDETNLVLRAARALAAGLGIAPRARIRLEKRIPIGAGLGGGSADAAVTLLLLRALWAPDLPDASLAAIAPGLGSDVPYFLTGGEADVSGRGRESRRGRMRPPSELLLVFPPFDASTRDVFDAFSRQTRSPEPLPERLKIESSGQVLRTQWAGIAIARSETGDEGIPRIRRSGGRGVRRFGLRLDDRPARREARGRELVGAATS